MKWLKNFERLLEIQRNIVWPSVTELDPKAFVPEVSYKLKTTVALIVSVLDKDVHSGGSGLQGKRIFFQFLKTPLSRQPCEKLIVSPKRQIVLEGVLTLMGECRTLFPYFFRC